MKSIENEIYAANMKAVGRVMAAEIIARARSDMTRLLEELGS